MRLALDTHILAYAEGVGDKLRCQAARHLVGQLPPEAVILPAQTLGELYRVLTAKAHREPAAAQSPILSGSGSFEMADSSWSAFQSALDLAVAHQLQLWDALILAVAAEHRCRLLLSGNFQEGFAWRGVTVLNPFASPPHPLLDMLKLPPSSAAGRPSAKTTAAAKRRK